jgi:hypothetical protein
MCDPGSIPEANIVEEPPMKTRAVGAGLILAVVAMALVLVSSPIAAQDKAATPVRPYGGSCSVAITPLTPPGVFPQVVQFTYDCILQHLGRTSAVAIQTNSLAGPPIGNVLIVTAVNESTYKAANGDLLYATFVGSGEIDLATGNVAFDGIETFTGGTGRFANAKGAAAIEGIASIFTNVGFFTADGTLAY